MAVRSRDPFDDFDRMANQMMKGFGHMDMGTILKINELGMRGGFFEDPFANDPFFNGSGFGRMGDMMTQMR